MNQYPDYTFYQNQNEIEVAAKPLTLSKVRLHMGIGAVAVVMVFLLTTVAQVFAHSLVLTLSPALAENEWYMWVLSGVPMYCFAMPISYLILRLIPTTKPQKQKLHPLMWFGFLCLCFALTYVANIIGQFVSDWIYNVTGLGVENQLGEMTIATPLIVNIIFVGILAPVFEELFYRKAIIDRLRRYGDVPAILISGLIFGLVHGNFNQVFYATFIGILLSFIYARTGSVLYTISIHAAFNFIGGVYSTELIRRVGEELIPAEGDLIGMAMVLGYSLFTIASLIIGVIFLIIKVKSFCRSLQKGEYSLTFGQWMNVIFVNPGVWMFIIAIAVLFITSLLG